MFDTPYLDISIATKSDHDTYMTCTRMKDACWRSISWNVFLPENKDYKLISEGIYKLLLQRPHFLFYITVWKISGLSSFESALRRDCSWSRIFALKNIWNFPLKHFDFLTQTTCQHLKKIRQMHFLTVSSWRKIFL